MRPHTHDWKALEQEFLKAHEETSISITEWCESKGINYATARRYIKVKKTKAKIIIKAKAETKSAKEKAKPKPKPKRKAKKTVKKPAKKTEMVRARQDNSVEMGIIKHGGYSQYFNRDINKLVNDTDLSDELELCRSRIHLVVMTIEEIQRRLEEKPPAEVAASLFDSLLKADIALDRNIARVESISKTLSAIRIDDLNEDKILADTERIDEVTKATVINAKKSIAQTELTNLQIEKVRKEVGGTSKLDEYIDNITENSDTVVDDAT